jgi:hypothetical protein
MDVEIKMQAFFIGVQCNLISLNTALASWKELSLNDLSVEGLRTK